MRIVRCARNAERSARASAVVSGISAEVAQTASGLGVRFGGARVAARVQEALALASAR